MADGDPTNTDRLAGRQETQPWTTGDHQDEYPHFDGEIPIHGNPHAVLDNPFVQSSSEPSKWVQCPKPAFKTYDTPYALKQNTAASNQAFPWPASDAEVSTIDPHQRSERASSNQDNALSGSANGKESSEPLPLCPMCRKYQPKNRRDAKQVES